MYSALSSPTPRKKAALRKSVLQTTQHRLNSVRCLTVTQAGHQLLHQLAAQHCAFLVVYQTWYDGLYLSGVTESTDRMVLRQPYQSAETAW